MHQLRTRIAEKLRECIGAKSCRRQGGCIAWEEQASACPAGQFADPNQTRVSDCPNWKVIGRSIVRGFWYISITKDNFSILCAERCAHHQSAEKCESCFHQHWRRRRIPRPSAARARVVFTSRMAVAPGACPGMVTVCELGVFHGRYPLWFPRLKSAGDFDNKNAAFLAAVGWWGARTLFEFGSSQAAAEYDIIHDLESCESRIIVKFFRSETPSEGVSRIKRIGRCELLFLGRFS